MLWCSRNIGILCCFGEDRAAITPRADGRWSRDIGAEVQSFQSRSKARGRGRCDVILQADLVPSLHRVRRRHLARNCVVVRGRVVVRMKLYV